MRYFWRKTRPARVLTEVGPTFIQKCDILGEQMPREGAYISRTNLYKKFACFVKQLPNKVGGKSSQNEAAYSGKCSYTPGEYF